MSDSIAITVTLHWHTDGGRQRLPMTCDDQFPQELIPSLVRELGLAVSDSSGDEIVYDLHLESEQRPALKLKELLSVQGVHGGSRLYLLPRPDVHVGLLTRCILQLPDGTEIVVPRNGQSVRREWLLESLRLHNPMAYQSELDLMAQRRSSYNYVANRNAHCVLRVSEKDYWVVLTGRADIWTEYATGQEFDRVPLDAPVRLDNGMRLRLGGSLGLELGILLV